jgi:hypothetical protein
MWFHDKMKQFVGVVSFGNYEMVKNQTKPMDKATTIVELLTIDLAHIFLCANKK